MPDVPVTAMSLAYRVEGRSQHLQGPVKAFIAPDRTPKKSAAFLMSQYLRTRVNVKGR